jgi:carboxyl-terminal processing protease
MPRRNFLCILLIGLASLVCYERSDRNPYGRECAKVIDLIEDEALVNISQQELFDGAIEGMVARLRKAGDQHSKFYPTDEVPGFMQELHQEIVGVGIRIETHPDLKQPVIIAPIYGSPADKAGILAGDVIVSVDGHLTKEESLIDVTKHIKGNAGIPVTLSVIHLGETEAINITIVRGHVSRPTISGDLPGAAGSWTYYIEGYGKIAYVRMGHFSDKSAKDLKSTLDYLRNTEMQALILDLRGNPGGRLDVAIEACDMFLQKDEVIVSTRDRRGEKDRPDAKASGAGTFTDFPMAVLIDQNSASASEIMAACLQDHERAVIVGQRSYGKGTVQNVISIEGGASRLKLTTSSFWRPSGTQIHRWNRDGEKATPEEDWGVRPDDGLLLEIDDKERRRLAEARHRRDYPQSPRRPAKEPAESEKQPDEKPKDSDEKKDEKTGEKKGEKNPDDKKPKGDASDGAEKPSPSKETADLPWPQIDRQLMLALEYLKKQVAE